MKYRKIPVEIEAFKYDGDFKKSDGIWCIPTWAKNAIDEGLIKIADYAEGTLLIKTLEGCMTTNVGDYIIQGVNGEIYPCKADIFEKTYVEVEACKDTLGEVMRKREDLDEVVESLNQKMEKELSDQTTIHHPIKLDNVNIGFDFSVDNKHQFKMLWNGQEVENVKNITLNIPAGEVPTMTVEIYLDSLNKDMFNK